jgi:hypothetical protein
MGEEKGQKEGSLTSMIVLIWPTQKTRFYRTTFPFASGITDIPPKILMATNAFVENSMLEACLRS